MTACNTCGEPLTEENRIKNGVAGKYRAKCRMCENDRRKRISRYRVDPVFQAWATGKVTGLVALPARHAAESVAESA